MPYTPEESMLRQLALGVIEAAINLALSHDARALEQVREYKGRVLRIKTVAPDWMFFVVLCDDGVQLFGEYEETVDARLTLPFTLLAQYVLGSAPTDLQGIDGVRVSGDLLLLAELLQVVQDFSIWTLSRRIINNWLPQYEGFSGLLEAMKNHDPAWIVRLEHLPQLANETLVAVKTQQELLQRQMLEIQAIRHQLDADRHANQISTIIGFCLLVVAFLAHNGYLQVPVIQNLSLDTVILLILSVVLLAPRLLGRR